MSDIFAKFITWVKGVMFKMKFMGDAKRVLHVEPAISPEMNTAIEHWHHMYREDGDWLRGYDKHHQTLGLPAAIAGEIARLVTVELKSTVEGSQRADYLQSQYEPVLKKLRTYTEYAAAGGGLAFKPYVDGKRIAVDCVEAWRFIPTAHNSLGEITGAVFVERVTKGKTFFTRMEHHQLTDAAYTIQNVAYASQNRETLGVACSLERVDEWAGLEPELTIAYQDGTAPDRALFAYFKLPTANQIDPSSPLGVSAYSRADKLIRQADEQWSRIQWEYEGSELAVDASDGALADGKHLPHGKERLFRQLGIDGGNGSDLYSVFSPEIRDGALFNGLNQILRRIEFNCSLAYGTLSDPQNVDKTAEEIKSSKERSYSTICDIQSALESALRHLLWAMDLYASLYQLAPSGEYDMTFSWGDGVMENVDTEYMRRKSLADSGYLRPELLLAYYFGTSEAEAKKMMPTTTKSLFI